jgi:hypothetical protein
MNGSPCQHLSVLPRVRIRQPKIAAKNQVLSFVDNRSVTCDAIKAWGLSIHVLLLGVELVD